MCRLLHSDELLQKYHLTEGVECECCEFHFTNDVLGFYFNVEHGQIEDHLIGMIDRYSYSPIRGFVYNAYCKDCNKFISTYEIRNLNDEYDMELAYYITAILLPRQLEFAQKRLEAYEHISYKIDSDDLEGLEENLRNNREYFEDLFSGLKDAGSFKELLVDEEFDIDEYLMAYQNEVYRLENTVYSINTGDEKYNLTLDGEKVPVDVCPNCKNSVKEFESFALESCPNCGSKHLLYRIGANYD